MAGRPLRSVHARIIPGNYLTPQDAPIGKKVYPAIGTTNQYISQNAVATELMRHGGKRIERNMPIRDSASAGILKPNAAVINEDYN